MPDGLTSSFAAVPYPDVPAPPAQLRGTYVVSARVARTGPGGAGIVAPLRELDAERAGELPRRTGPAADLRCVVRVSHLGGRSRGRCRTRCRRGRGGSWCGGCRPTTRSAGRSTSPSARATGVRGCTTPERGRGSPG
ncbi:hypothetical protein [Streptomyces canarius]